MIIPKGSKLTGEQIAQVERIANDFDCSILEIQGRNRCVYAILGDEGREVMFKRIAGLSFIRRVDMIESPYKLMDKRSGLSDHVIKLGKEEIGESFPFIIGGPCTIDPDQPNLYLETAHALKECGVHALRGGVWKPRTNPYSYQGDSKALEIIARARD